MLKKHDEWEQAARRAFYIVSRILRRSSPVVSFS